MTNPICRLWSSAGKSLFSISSTRTVCSQAFHCFSNWNFDISFGLTLHLNLSFVCEVWLFYYSLLCTRLKRIVISNLELLNCITILLFFLKRKSSVLMRLPCSQCVSSFVTHSYNSMADEWTWEVAATLSTLCSVCCYCYCCCCCWDKMKVHVFLYGLLFCIQMWVTIRVSQYILL
jgi:hypothetical protein